MVKERKRGGRREGTDSKICYLRAVGKGRKDPKSDGKGGGGLDCNWVSGRMVADMTKEGRKRS